MSEETLPEGWTWAELGELAHNRDNQRVPVSAKERAERLGNVPYFGAAGPVGWIDEAIYDEDLLLVGEDGIQFFDPYKPKAYLVSGPAWVNNHAHVLSRLSGGSDLRYLKYYLDQFDYQGYANGTTRLKLTRSAMDRIPVAIAPLDEQQRIVDELERRLSHVDAAEKSVDDSLRRIAAARRAIVNEAIAGRLVSQHPSEGWPENTRPEGSVDIDNSDLPELPEGWIVARLGAIAEMSLGKMLDKKQQTGNHPTPYLRNINVRWFSFYLGDLAEMDVRPEELDRVTVREGDLVVCEGGEPGRCAVWRSEPIAIQKALHRVRPHDGISSAYLALVLRWWSEQQGFDRFITGSTIRHIPKERLRSVPVPLPPPGEQARIVAEAERRLSLLDAAEVSSKAALAKAKHLRRSLLAAAFSGKLVPQNADDEPADDLLARIRAERAAAAPVKRARKATAQKAKSKKEVPA